MKRDPDFAARGEYWAKVAALANQLWRESGAPPEDNDDRFWLAALRKIETPPRRSPMSMIERVARAICHVRLCGVNDENWVAYEDEARAAIEAMRSSDIRPKDEQGAIHELRGAPNDIWKMLFDAALSEDQSAKPKPNEHGTE